MLAYYWQIVYNIYIKPSKGGANMPYAWTWLAVMVVLIIIEVITPQFVTIWFALGALLAFIAALFNLPIWGQVTLFLATSFIFLVLTRPFYEKYVKTKIVATNVNSVIGQTGIVVEEIGGFEKTGQVKVGGQIWTAQSNDNQLIEKERLVEVMEVSGVKLIVKEK